MFELQLRGDMKGVKDQRGAMGNKKQDAEFESLIFFSSSV